MAPRSQAAKAPTVTVKAPEITLAQRPEICVMRASNGWVVFDSSPGNLLRKPILVAESPARLSDIIATWASTQVAEGCA